MTKFAFAFAAPIVAIVTATSALADGRGAEITNNPFGGATTVVETSVGSNGATVLGVRPVAQSANWAAFDAHEIGRLK